MSKRFLALTIFMFSPLPSGRRARLHSPDSLAVSRGYRLEYSPVSGLAQMDPSPVYVYIFDHTKQFSGPSFPDQGLSD